MRSRKTVLSALTITQLRRLATLCNVLGRGSKADLISRIAAKKRVALTSLLDALTRAELREIADRLALSRNGTTKDDLVAVISGDRSRALRSQIVKSLRHQGFRISDGRISLPKEIDKDQVRALHVEAVEHKRAKSAPSLAKKEEELLTWIANGNEIDPHKLRPVLIEVTPDSIEERLFRYVSLHWTIPVSSGYGRRLRYIVVDAYNQKLMGLIGLGDPVFALAPRDAWIGWNSQQRRVGLHHVLDAFVLGAVPPYSQLLCGKLIAMLAASRDVTSRFCEKYGGRQAIISGKQRTGEVALITTTSALGRSSVYNRIKYHNEPLFVPVGFTRGSGEFQFLNGLYEEMAEFADARLIPTAKNELWGSGFRNRREVVKKCLQATGLHQDLLYHGVQRQVFVVPVASNSAAFLRGEEPCLSNHDMDSTKIFAWFRDRWLLKRAANHVDYKAFDRDSYKLWHEIENTP